MATVGVKTLIDFDVKNYDFYFFLFTVKYIELGDLSDNVWLH